jgi:hypothetical protein
MPKKKRRTEKQPEPVPVSEPIAKVKKRRRRRLKPAIEPVTVAAAPKTLMQIIFEAQRTEVDRLNEALRTKVFESLDF